MKINFKNVYEDRIIEIDKQIKVATNNKKWVAVAKLEAEKVDTEKKIKQIEVMQHGR